MSLHCKNIHCSAFEDPGIRPKPNGHYYRTSDQKYIRRYKCSLCKLSVQNPKGDPWFREKRRDINESILELISRGVSQRAIAKLLGVNHKTIPAKIIKMAPIIQDLNFATQFLIEKASPVEETDLDEMETFEHSKLKPLAIPLIVEKESRFILDITACIMPSKGLLAKKSRAKYGKRKNERREHILRLLEKIKYMHPRIHSIDSDECPMYFPLIKKALPEVHHKAHKGIRGCVVGQGEIKASHRDPLFSLNHTCAMLRDNLKTLSRRTWCTVKKLERFKMLLQIYQYKHNQRLLELLKSDTNAYGSAIIPFSFS